MTRGKPVLYESAVAGDAVMRAGRHAAEFHLLRGDYGWGQSYACFGVVGPLYDPRTLLPRTQREQESVGAPAHKSPHATLYHANFGARIGGDDLAGDWGGKQPPDMTRAAVVGDVVGMLLDLDAGSLSVYLNGVLLGKLVESGLQGPLRCAVDIGGKCAVSVERVAPGLLGLLGPDQAEEFLRDAYYRKTAEGKVISNGFFECWVDEQCWGDPEDDEGHGQPPSYLCDPEWYRRTSPTRTEGRMSRTRLLTLLTCDLRLGGQWPRPYVLSQVQQLVALVMQREFDQMEELLDACDQMTLPVIDCAEVRELPADWREAGGPAADTTPTMLWQGTALVA